MGMENFPSVRSVVFTRVLVVYHLPHIVHLSCLHTIQQLHTQRKWSQQLNTNTKILCVNISYQSHENSPKSRGLYECVSSSIWSPASLIACIMIRQQWPRLCFGDFSPSSHFFFVITLPFSLRNVRSHFTGSVFSSLLLSFRWVRMFSLANLFFSTRYRCLINSKHP